MPSVGSRLRDLLLGRSTFLAFDEVVLTIFVFSLHQSLKLVAEKRIASRSLFEILLLDGQNWNKNSSFLALSTIFLRIRMLGVLSLDLYLDPGRAPLALDDRLFFCHALLALAELPPFYVALLLGGINLGLVGDFILHLSNALGVLVDALHLVIEFFLLLQVSHFVAIGFVLEVLCPVFLCQERLPELSNLFHDIESAKLWVLLHNAWTSFFHEDHIG